MERTPDKKKKGKRPGGFVDDGRVIANMNVEGMPYGFRRRDRRRFDEFGEKKQRREPVELTRAEKKAIGRGTTAAYLLVAAVVIGVFALFLLFCTKVWFR